MELKDTKRHITKIEVQKKDSRRRSIFVDRRFLMGMYYKVIESLNLEVGGVWDDEIQSVAEAEDSYYKGLKKAADLLYRSSKTKKQLVQKLIQRAYSEAVANRIADELETKGFINDALYAEQFIENRGRRYGAYRLRQELSVKGVADSVIDAALERVEQASEDERALGIGRKRIRQYAGEPREKVYPKLTGYLSRRGFGYDVVKRVVSQLLEGWGSGRQED